MCFYSFFVEIVKNVFSISFNKTSLKYIFHWSCQEPIIGFLELPYFSFPEKLWTVNINSFHHICIEMI